MNDQQNLLDRCLSLRQNLCLERDNCEKLLENAPSSWTVEQLHQYRELRDETAHAIEQLDRGLATLQGVNSDEPVKKKSRPWALVAFALLFLLFAIALG